MRLTRRGRVVAGFIAVGFVWAAIFGIQTMNGVILPGIVALVAGWWLVRTADDVSVRREPVEAGFPGQPREVAVSVSVPPSLSGTVVDTVPDHVRVSKNRESASDTEEGLISSARGRRTETTERRELPVVNGMASYYVRTGQRGVIELGPAETRLTDPFGLVEKTVDSVQPVEVVTYPPVRELIGLREQQHLLPEGGPTPDRHEFDRLREYDRGDTPRDIDWKSSAKRGADPLIVKEFVSETEAGDVQIVAESEPGDADTMASAAASIALQLLREGIAVGVVTADHEVPLAAEGTQEGKILTALARTNGGRVDPLTRSRGSIEVWGSDGDAEIDLGQGTVSFGQLSAESVASASRAVTDGGWPE